MTGASGRETGTGTGAGTGAGTTEDLPDRRRALVAACRHLAARGLSPGSSGNLSVRVGDVLLVTPTGSSLSRVTSDELAVVPLDAATGPGGEGPRPSKEVPLHRAVYAARPDARAVVHLHSPYATALACLPPRPDGGAPLPALTPYAAMRLGALPVAPYARPGSQGLADGVARLAARHAVLLLAQHGPVVSAGSLDAATDLAEELETAAQLAFLLHGTGARTLTPEQVAELGAELRG